MHIYFSGIGGAGLGPLALIAKQAGYTVSGSDKQDSSYIQYLRKNGITNIHIGQTYEAIDQVHTKEPIDWFVFTTAVTSEHANPPELVFCKDNNIRTSKRDELLNKILEDKELQLIAIAGTHGKTTTTAMAVWLFQQLSIPVSYSVGAKLPSGDMGAYVPESSYFIYEADEYARNFLSFHPYMSLITGIDWDHPDIYPTRKEYEQAFKDFVQQSAHTVTWEEDTNKLTLKNNNDNTIISTKDSVFAQLTLPGEVNRRDAFQVITAVHQITDRPLKELVTIINNFPGVSRRFEQIAPNLYTDYAHTPPKIRGALQLAHEVAGENVVVVYEGLHNTRQHFIKDDLRTLFKDTKHLYVVPSYLAREDPNLSLLQPSDLKTLMHEPDASAITPSELNDSLAQQIRTHIQNGDLVLCLSAGGGNSLDEWLRMKFTS